MDGSVGTVMIRSVKVCGPGVTVGEVRGLLADEHVHAALVVDAVDADRLLTVVERADVAGLADDEAAVAAGTLEGRTVLPDAPAADALATMLATGRRRLAVADATGRLVGLLCLKRSGTGFCSDEDVLARAEDPH